MPNLASQIRIAFSSIALNTGSRSPGDELMTRNTSAVAVCCSSDSRNSVSSRVFSMAITACAAKLVHQFDLLLGEGPDFLTINRDRADKLVVLHHRHDENRARARRLDQPDDGRLALEIGFFGGISAT